MQVPLISLVIDIALTALSAYLIWSRWWWKGYAGFLERRSHAAENALKVVVAGHAKMAFFGMSTPSAQPPTDCPACQQQAKDDAELVRTDRFRVLEDVACPSCGRQRSICVPE